MGRFSPGRPSAVIVVLLLVAVLVARLRRHAHVRPDGGDPAPGTAQGPVSTEPPASHPSPPPTTVPPTTAPPTTAPATTIQASVGSPGAGDPYFPSAGNGGYDVQSYEISLDIDPVERPHRRDAAW